MHESQSRSGLIQSHYPTYATCSIPIHAFMLHTALSKCNVLQLSEELHGHCTTAEATIKNRTVDFEWQ